jgi:L-serine dehydratase
VRDDKVLRLGGKHTIAFSMDDDLVLHRRKRLPFHSNGMRFTARNADGHVLLSREYYSVGGGFVLDEDEIERADLTTDDRAQPVPHPFSSGDELLRRTRETGLRISELMLANELTRRSEEEIRSGLLQIWTVMQQCVDRGVRATGILPGGLKVRRRAGALRQTLEATEDENDPLRAMEWVTLYALAVNEENAAGGRVVTAPTNGAAGIVPAVLHYYRDFIDSYSEDGVVRFLLASAAVGIPVQGERLDLRCGGGLPGRGRFGVLDGGGRAGRGPRGHAGPGGERRGDRYRAQPGADLRPHRGVGADPVHRAQCRRVDQGHHRGPDGGAR